MKTKVLITGAKGQLAKTIHEMYSNNNDGIDFTFVSKKELDITNSHQIKSYFNSQHFNYCINCAAFTNVEQSEKEPDMAFNINAEAVNVLAVVCKNNNVILIHISTDYVFDGEKHTAYTIDDLSKPLNVYGNSKLKGEEYIQKVMNNFFIVRTFWLYSKTHGHNFYKTILKKAMNNESIKVIDNQVSCPTNCLDLSSHLYKIIKNESKN